MPRHDLKGRHVLVTGASSGIGATMATALARRGAHVGLMARREAELSEVAARVEAAGGKAAIAPTDVTDAQAVATALAQLETELGPVYGLIANAGLGGENQYGEQDRWQEIIDTNLTGTYQTIQECLPLIKKNPAPFKIIVIISSILARLGVPGYSAYCASKAGLLGLTRSLAGEYSNDGILVNALCPGWVDTEMAQEGLQGFAEALKISKEDAYKEAMKQVPLGKMSKPEEVAQLVAYLVSEEQTSLTGQTLDINNGALMP